MLWYEIVILILAILIAFAALLCLILATSGKSFKTLKTVFVFTGFGDVFGTSTTTIVTVTGGFAPNDSFNCGGTGIVCDSSLGQVCINGVCQCVAGSTLCTGLGCVDLLNASFACGSCTNVCTGGSICCTGACQNILRDPLNCGGCSKVCTGINPQCCAGFCKDLDTDDKSCGFCYNACPEGTKCCGGICKDFSNDSQNCNGCGIVCPANTICESGICVAGCPPGQTLCSGQCKDTVTDSSNCGTCGTICPPGTYCNGSFCRPNVCTSTGTVFCPQNGLCINITTSGYNCGACGNQCTLFCQSGSCWCSKDGDCGPSTTCVNNICTFPSCPVGQTFCPVIGQCINIDFSSTNCGACGRECAPGFTCTAGICGCSADNQCPLGTVCVVGACVFN